MSYSDRPRSERLRPAIGATVVQLGLAAAVVWGLSGHFDAPAQRSDGFVSITPSLDPPPQPKPSPRPRPEGGAAKAGASAKKSPEEAPTPKVDIAQVEAAAAGKTDKAGTGPGTTSAGTGGGAGGNGTGSGSGAGGGGTGSGIASPPVRIAGALRDSDYPRDALPFDAGGTVTIDFRVTPSGSVEDCRPVGSSGYARLDNLTCTLFLQRFRFRPARDASGQPVATRLRTSFTWGVRRH